MVQTSNKNLSSVRKFQKEIKMKIKVDKLILFGSRAKGTFNSLSDFDLLLVSNSFKDIPWYKRSIKLYPFWKEDLPLELLCYTPEEFERKKKQMGIVQEAVKEGIEI